MGRDSSGRITSHLSGLFYRTAKLMEMGIKPVFVFDGKHPKFKKKTQESRIKMREEAAEKLKIAREEGDIEKIRLYSQAAVKLNKDMINEAKALLKLMGIQVIEAPSEAEAQAAYMTANGISWASGSQDWDSLLFGCPRLIKNINISGKRKIPGKLIYSEIKPELIELEKVLKSLEINRDQLIMLGILVGTDFWSGLVDWIKNTLLESYGNVSPNDLHLVDLVDTEEEVIDILNEFYKKYNLSPNF